MLLNIYYNKGAIVSVTVKTTELVQLPHPTRVTQAQRPGNPAPGLSPSSLLFLGRGEQTSTGACCMLGAVLAVRGRRWGHKAHFSVRTLSSGSWGDLPSRHPAVKLWCWDSNPRPIPQPPRSLLCLCVEGGHSSECSSLQAVDCQHIRRTRVRP